MIGFGQQTYVPDDNFEQALINLGYDNVLDDSVLTANINTVTYLNVSNGSIADLTGIEGFTALTSLNCNINQLTSLDLSNNTALTDLRCYGNQLTTLDVSTNTALTYLNCYNNQLTSLDVSNNAALTSLECHFNQLTSLDVSNNIALTDLWCRDNQLTSLDVSNNTALTSLHCHNNQLTSLDVSGATVLTYLHCRYNQLTSLDVTNNTALTSLHCDNNQLTSLDVINNITLENFSCSDNQLTSLDLSNNTTLWGLDCRANQLTSLDVSNNPALIYLFCTNNQLTSLDVSNNTALSNLTCDDNQLTSLDLRNGNNTNILPFNNYPNFDNNPQLYCIDVDDPTWSTTYWTNIDPWASFSLDCATTFGCTDSLALNYDPSANIDDGSCTYQMTYVPDDNFEQALINLGYDNVLDDSVLTANINTVTNLDVNSQNIYDLTGIEDFTALSGLFCYNNQLTSLDVSNNTALSLFYCDNNQLTNLDLSQNTALSKLVCNDNQLDSLDVSQNTALHMLYCWNNQLTTLDLSGATALSSLWCQNNQLDSLDVSQNTALQYLYCNYNQLDSLNVSNNTALIYLYCYSNQLTSLDVSQNTALKILACYNNQLTTLNVSNNPDLLSLRCENNQLTTLDVRNGNNQNISTTSYYLNLTNNPQLYCIDVDDPTWSTTNWTNIDPWASFSSNCTPATCGPITGVNLTDVIHDRATFNWNNMNISSCQVDQIRIRYREVGTNSWSLKTMGVPVGSGCNISNTSKLVLGLTPSTTYEYDFKIWYCNASTVNWHANGTFTTADDCPNVGNLAVTTPSTTKATFTWDDSNGPYSFVRIKMRADTLGGITWFNAGGMGVAYGIFTKNKNNLSPGTSYRAQARTWCSPNGGAWKSPAWTSLIYWTMPTVIRLEGGSAIANLAIYPNPSRDVFNVTFTSEDVQDLGVRVLNIVGEVVYTEDLDQFIGEYTKAIDLATYTKGIYFLEIETNDGIINKKLILQ